MSASGARAMVLQTLKKLAAVWRSEAERDNTPERHARMAAREHKKQLKERKKQLKWEVKRARQNGRDEQARMREVVKEQAVKRLGVNGTTRGGARTAKPRRHERVKNARKRLGRAQRELHIQELCYNIPAVQPTCEVRVVCLGVELKEQPSEDTVVKEVQQEQQYNEVVSDSGSEPVLDGQGATPGLVAWLMVPLNWMVARLR